MKTELEFLKYIKYEMQSAKNGEGISFNLKFINRDIDKRIKELEVTNTAVDTIKEMKEFMETLKDFDTWKEWKNTNPIEEVEWDDSHELNNVMNEMVECVFPHLTTKEHWQQIDWDTEEYSTVLYKTQELEPIDSGNSLHCHHSDYDVDGTMYRLTWTIGGGISESPIMERKIN